MGLSWDHCPLYARIQDGRDAEQIIKKRKRKKNLFGWAPKTVEHKIEFTKKIKETDGRGVDEHLTTIQKNIEFAAGKVAHCTKAERQNFTENTR